MPPVKTSQGNRAVAPFTREVKLKWVADFANLTSAGSSYAGKMFYSNNLYDPDPSLLTSSVSGFADNMDFYFYCLPLSLSARVVLTNREDFPVKVALLHSINQADLLFSSTQNIIDLGENTLSTGWRELAAKGGQDRTTLSLFVNFGEVNGNEFEYFGNAQSYSCQPASGPPYPMFLSILSWASTNFTSAGIGVMVEFKWTVKLWAQNLILDTGPTISSEIAHLKRELKDHPPHSKRTSIDYTGPVPFTNRLLITSILHN